MTVARGGGVVATFLLCLQAWLLSACIEEDPDFLGPAPCPKAVGELVEDEQRFHYGPDPAQELILFRHAEAEAPRPMLVWIHGGAWMVGAHDPVPTEIQRLAQLSGYHLATVGYRLSHTVWPDTVRDPPLALAWLFNHAEQLGIDRDRIVLVGASAGAHLAALTALAGPELLQLRANDSELAARMDAHALTFSVAAVIGFYGIFDLTATNSYIEQMDIPTDDCNYWLPEQTYAQLFDCGETTMPAEDSQSCRQSRARIASPMAHVRADSPAFLLLHGQRDCLIPWTQSAGFAQRLASLGVTTEVELPAKGDHNFASLDLDLRSALQFLDANVGCGAQ